MFIDSSDQNMFKPNWAVFVDPYYFYKLTYMYSN